MAIAAQIRMIRGILNCISEDVSRDLMIVVPRGLNDDYSAARLPEYSISPRSPSTVT
jgi:hypothetical protein